MIARGGPFHNQDIGGEDFIYQGSRIMHIENPWSCPPSMMTEEEMAEKADEMVSFSTYQLCYTSDGRCFWQYVSGGE